MADVCDAVHRHDVGAESVEEGSVPPFVLHLVHPGITEGAVEEADDIPLFEVASLDHLLFAHLLISTVLAGRLAAHGESTAHHRLIDDDVVIVKLDAVSEGLVPFLSHLPRPRLGLQALTNLSNDLSVRCADVETIDNPANHVVLVVRAGGMMAKHTVQVTRFHVATGTSPTCRPNLESVRQRNLDLPLRDL